MRRLLPLVAGAAAGTTIIRARRARARAERLAAALLETVLRAIDANDAETGRHVRRVARYALIVADAAGLDEHEQRNVERVALFHDIGKIHEALFDLIHDPSELTPEERESVRTHPARGADVLAPIAAFYPSLAEGVLSHHERWDGSGYPRGLAGTAIPIEARVVSIADAFDAMTYRRRYSAGRSLDEARELIAAARGTQFDPRLADIFLADEVFARVRDAAREATPRPRRAAPPSDDPAPDVEFRWRTVTQGVTP